MMKEEWRPVSGYEGIYEVSSEGRIRSIVSRAGSRCGLLTEKFTSHGYVYIDLARDGVKRRFLVHALVATVFIGQRPTDGHQVNHRDGTKRNNVFTNLEWVTPRENNMHALATGLRRPTDVRGVRNPNARLTIKQVAEILALAGKESQRSIAKRYGICKSMVGNIHQRKAWNMPSDLMVQQFHEP